LKRAVVQHHAKDPVGYLTSTLLRMYCQIFKTGQHLEKL